MPDEHKKEQATELQSVLQTHPDYTLFFKLGSPMNLLSYEFETGEFMQQKSMHYPQSQVAFASHAMKSLMDLARKEEFNPPEIVDRDFCEKIYEHIAIDRSKILLDTAKNYLDKRILQYVAGDQNALRSSELISQQETIKTYKERFERISYTPSDKTIPTSTQLSQKGFTRYARYDKIKSTQNALMLNHVTSLLGEVPGDSSLDGDIKLGQLVYKKDVCKKDQDRLMHFMGLYRLGEEKQKIDRVDEVTAFAAQKCLETDDKDEALKYALIFGILRGYNIRSMTGACHGMEISMRWLFEKKGWEQFRKAPGFYLDIEASLLERGKKSPEEILDNLLKNLVEEIKVGGSKFDVAKPATKEEFAAYLLHTNQYRPQDLSEIIDLVPSALKDAAQNGNVDFLTKLNLQCQSDEVLKQKIIGLNLKEVRIEALNYGDPNLLSQVENLIDLKLPPTPSITSPTSSSVTPPLTPTFP